MQPRGLRYCNGCAIVPFILPAGVEIDVGLATNDRHCFCPGAAHRQQFRAQFFGERYCFGSGAGAADDNFQRVVRWRQDMRLFRTQSHPQRGQGNRSDLCYAAHSERDMDRPVAPALAIFAGAVQWVDYPDTADRTARATVDFFF